MQDNIREEGDDDSAADTDYEADYDDNILIWNQPDESYLQAAQEEYGMVWYGYLFRSDIHFTHVVNFLYQHVT
jgi:hypothetical protein